MGTRSLFTGGGAPTYTLDPAPEAGDDGYALTYSAATNSCTFQDVSGAGVLKSFQTTDNLAGTTLNNGGNLAAGYTGLVTLTSSASFATSGYLRIESEVMSYDSAGVGANQLNITARGVFGSSDVLHADATNVGELYDSGLLLLDGWTQVATKVQCDQSCGMLFVWYSDPLGAQEIRRLEPIFHPANVFDFLSTGAFGPYVRYTIAPSSGANTTSLFFTTDFTTMAINPQLFTLDSGIFGTMVSQLGRAVIAGQNSSGTYGNVLTTDDRELLTNTLASSKASCIAYEALSTASTTYVLMIDLDNSGGEWPHDPCTGIGVDNVSSSVVFASSTAEAVIRLGVIVRIDGTDADIHYLINRRVGSQNANDTIEISDNFQPSNVIFKQSGGSTVGSLSSVAETTAAVNTGGAIASPAGTTIPALGDVVMKLEYVADAFSSNLTVLYHALDI